MVEYWSDAFRTQYSDTPLLHDSNSLRMARELP
jgi:hypothetical protein